MSLNKKKLFRQLFHIAGADKVVYMYLLVFLGIASILWLIEPEINTFFDSIWFCFATATTIGYGDIQIITTLGRVLTMILSGYSLIVVSILTAIVTSFFLEQSKSNVIEVSKRFWKKLENLDNLSEEELKALSNKIKEYNKD